MLLTHSQPILTKDFSDLSDGTCGIVAEITDDDVGLVYKDPRSLLQFRDTDSRINITVIVRTTDDNLGSLFVRTSQVRSNAIRRGRHLFDYFVQLLNRLPGL